MLKIQSGITKNSTPFGNGQPRIVVLNTEDYNHVPDWQGNSEEADYVEIKDHAQQNYQKANTTSPFDYTEENYNDDKSFLEQQKENVENFVNNVDTPKPFKTVGKIILGAITMAMGFVSMKWATLASWKIAEDIVTNPKTQKLVSGMAKPFKDGFNATANAVKKSGISEKISDAVSESAEIAGKKFNASKSGKTINEFLGRIKENKFVKDIIALVKKGYNKVADTANSLYEKITGVKFDKDKIKSYVSNFFGVSGGVTAGVDTLQRNSKISDPEDMA